MVPSFETCPPKGLRKGLLKEKTNYTYKLFHFEIFIIITVEKYTDIWKEFLSSFIF